MGMEVGWPAKPQIFILWTFTGRLLTPDLRSYFEHYNEFAKMLLGLHYSIRYLNVATGRTFPKVELGLQNVILSQFNQKVFTVTTLIHSLLLSCSDKPGV